MNRYRTVWISDIHLGTRGSKAKELLEWLRTVECETLYLVGDIIDLWKLRAGWNWPKAHNDVILHFMKMARAGTRVVFVPGNHDEYFRDYLGHTFAGIEVLGHDVHVTADERRLLVIHADQFDALVVKHKWVAVLGSYAYDWLLSLNTVVAWTRKRLGLPYWSLSAYLKHKAKTAVTVMERFVEVTTDAARRKGMDGIVCGHIHKAEIIVAEDGVTYYNDGDWVESCSALVEHDDGRMELIWP